MNNIITFFGGDSQVGTSMISQSVGEILVKNNSKVLLILASCQYGNDYIKENIELSLDDIKFDNNAASMVREVEKIVYGYNNLDIMQGSNNLIAMRYYGEIELQKIIESVRNKYDFLLIDGGHNVQFGLTMASLKLSSMKYFVITQHEKSMRRFIYVRDTILNPLDYKGEIVINKYVNNVGFYNKSEISKIVGKDINHVIPYIEYGHSAEQEKNTLLKHPKFYDAVSTIVNDILGDGVKKNEDIIHKKRGLFKWK